MRPIHLLALLAPSLALGLSACGDDGEGGETVVPLSISSFSSNASTVEAGQTVDLIWATAGAAAVSIFQSPPGVHLGDAENVGAAGTVTSQPINFATTFTLTATSAAGEVQTKTVDVDVEGVSIVSFTASPASAGRGTPVQLSWVLGGSPPSSVVLEDAAMTELYRGTDQSNAITVTPDQTTTYTLRVQAFGETATAMATVTITSQPPTIEYFEARANVNGTVQKVDAVASGSPAQLFWRVQNATDVRILRGTTVIRDWSSQGLPSGSFRAPAPDSLNTYTFEARNGPDAADLSTTTTTVAVQATPTIDALTISPATYPGASTMATLTWSTSNTDTTELSVAGTAVTGFPGTPSGTFTVSVSGQTTFTLTAISQVATTTQDVSIQPGYVDVEPNDTLAGATPLLGDGVPVRGTVTSTDADIYSLTVPADGFVTARLTSPASTDCSALNPTLTLLDSTGATVGTVNATGACPSIFPPAGQAFAEKLAAGTYYVRVSAAPTTDGRYEVSAVASTIAPALSQVTVTRVMAPQWSVTDLVMTSLVMDLDTTGAGVTAIVNRAFAPRHTVTPAALTVVPPAVAAVSDFSQELRTIVASEGGSNKTSFSRAEWEDPAGLFYGYTIAPVSTSTGTSLDYPTGGPVISNDVLPIDITSFAIDDGGSGLSISMPPSIPSASSAFSGQSHVHLLHVLSPSVLPSAPTLPLSWAVNISLRDATGAGYDLSFPFSVSN